mmetsp:Transcript_8688/g.17629  ORF Transcript_8688/g.17629 Transcript_8688/m.17629 type:complete len:521 (-) Transcript_8688:1247-2809(-)
MSGTGETVLLCASAVVAAIHLDSSRLYPESRVLAVLAVLVLLEERRTRRGGQSRELRRGGIANEEDDGGRESEQSWAIKLWDARRARDPVGCSVAVLLPAIVMAWLPPTPRVDALHLSFSSGLWALWCSYLKGSVLANGILSAASAGLMRLLLVPIFDVRLTWVSIAESLAFGVLARALFVYCRRCFTLAESTVVALLSLTMVSSLIEISTWPARYRIEVLVQTAAFLVVGTQMICLVFIPTVLGHVTRTSAWLSSTLCAALAYAWLFYVADREPFGLVLSREIFTLSRLILTLFWGACLSLIITTSLPQRLPIPKIMARKAYHLLAVVMFAPGIRFEFAFQSMAFSIALALLVTLELLRLGSAWPTNSERFQRFFFSLVDDRDSGPLVLTHLYLLIGCALPVWLMPLQESRTNVRDIAYIGLASLGISDTFASVVGKRFGTLRWFGTEKTLEGTLAAWLCGALFQWLMSEKTSLLVIGAAMIPVTLLEAWTEQVDNLILPPYAFAVVSFTNSAWASSGS